MVRFAFAIAFAIGFLVSLTLGDTVTVVGSNGSNGSNGTPGNPGTNGSNGTVGGTANAVNHNPIDLTNTANAFGGTGGLGGDGGNGTGGGAPGGNGGDGAVGGDASADTTNGPMNGNTSTNANAYGGAGGSAGDPGVGPPDGFGGNAGTGGNAVAITDGQSLDGGAQARSYSKGGLGGSASFGNGGDGGDAESTSTAVANHSSAFVFGRAESIGGNGGNAGGLGGIAGNGGSAFSWAQATNSAINGDAFVLSEATGGTAGFNPMSQAYGLYGDATAYGDVTADFFAESTVRATGRNALANSTASGEAAIAYTRARSNLNATNGVTNTMSYAYVESSSTARTESFTSTAGVLRSLSNADNMNSYSYSTAYASDADVISHLGSNSAVANRLSVDSGAGTVGANVIGLGNMGSLSADNLDSDDWGELEVQFDWFNGSFDGKTIMLGLYDGQISSALDYWSLDVTCYGSNFSDSWSSNDTDFATLFDDNVLDLGIQEWALTGDSSVSLFFYWETATAGEGASFAFVVAAVPEPTSGALCLFTLAAIALRRHRRILANA